MSVLAHDVMKAVRRLLGLVPSPGEAHADAVDVAEAPTRPVSDRQLLSLISAEEAALVHEVKAQHAPGYRQTFTTARASGDTSAPVASPRLARILYAERAPSPGEGFVRALPVTAGELLQLSAMGRTSTAALPVLVCGSGAVSGAAGASEVHPGGGVVRVHAMVLPPDRSSGDDEIPAAGAFLAALVLGTCARVEEVLALDEIDRGANARIYASLRRFALGRIGRSRRDGTGGDYASRGRLDDDEVTVA